MGGLIGRVLGQNYRVVEPIGVGGMGMVFVVEHVNLPRRFAAKILTPELARHPEAIARFAVEARAVSELEHENIVGVVDYGKTDDGCVFMIMELLHGETLQARIDREPLSLEDTVSVVIQVCRALAAAHAAGIVHRDIKPDNVFLHQRPRMRPMVKVLDFGVSKAREGTARDGRITRQGQILGSPEYMSPEASRGEEVDARADVYAVGIMLYQLLCGDVPFRHENYLKVLQMQVGHAPLAPRVLVPDLPDALERVILRALEKDPALRQPSIEELELDLAAAIPEVVERAMVAGMVSDTHRIPLQESVVAPAPPGPPGPPVPPVPPVPREGTTLDTRRRPRRAIVIALWCVALALAAAAFGLWIERRHVGGDPPPARAGAQATGSRAERAERAQRAADRPEAFADGDRSSPSVRPGAIHLRVDSSPRGATVTLDGAVLGRTPIDAQMPSAHRDGQLELELGGYRTARRLIARDRDGEVRVSLQRDVRRRPQGGRPEPSSRGSDRGDGSDRSSDLPAIKESR
jgi:eukaryotic-like serine/threonine-protein kinase